LTAPDGTPLYDNLRAERVRRVCGPDARGTPKAGLGPTGLSG